VPVLRERSPSPSPGRDDVSEHEVTLDGVRSKISAALGTEQGDLPSSGWKVAWVSTSGSSDWEA